MGLEEKTINTRRKIATSGFFLLKTSAPPCQRRLHHRCSRRISFSTPPSTLFAVIVTLLILILMIAQAQAELKVNEFGVRKIKTGDMAMIFYANISYTGVESGPIVARLHMDRCCVQVPPDQHPNCQAMKLISGLGKVFHPNENYILQMYFINFDLLDREGSCNIRLLSRSPKNRKSQGNQDQTDWEKGDTFTVPFKTVLKKPGALGKLISGSSEGYRICDSDNYNALHDCSNFDDCLVRYSGELSLFNKSSGQCVKTPECQDHNSTFLSFITRKCETIHQISRTVSGTFSYDMHYVDANIFSKGPSMPTSLLQRNNVTNSSSSSSPIHPQLVCEHGYHVKGKDGRDNCTCHQGWRSMTMEEWQQRGGKQMDNWETAHKMCTVPLIDQRTRGLLILGFFFVCLIIPFIGMLWCNRSKKKDAKENQTSVKKFLEQSSSSSAADESDAEQENKRKPVKATCKLKSTHRVLNEMEDEEANKVISEITNRREPTLSKKSSKRDKNEKDGDDDKSGAPLPPSSSEPSVPPSTKSSTGGEGTAFTGSKTSQQEGGSKVQSSTSTAFQSTRPASRSTMPPDPPPPAPLTPSSSKSTMPSPPQPIPSSHSTKPSSAGAASVSKTSHLSYFSPSSTGFDYTGGEEREVDQRRRFDKLNMNVATQVPSTDDLLTMNRREKYGAHQPITPVGEDLGASVMVADCATVELKDDDKVMLNSLSSEEITQKKQQEWAQFIESMSEEKIHFRPGHFSISVESRNTIENFMEEEEEEEGEVEQYSRLSRQGQSQLTDFQYFHKDHNHNNNSKATKVQSVPGMMTYHPFSSMTTYCHPETDLPEPPVHFIQKALKQLPPEEHESRHEAYRILNSLSNERILSSRSQEIGGMLKSANSIWSNIASENANELSATPTTSAFGSRVESSCDGDEDMIRTNTIYGNLLGSDVDSDEALDEIAVNNNNLDPNRTIYGCPPTHTTTPIPPMSSQQTHDSLESVTRPPSEFFIDSTDASTVTSRTVSSTDCEFWRNIAGQSVGSGEDDKLEGACGGGGGATRTMSPLTSSAYQIKSSLETALKASKSRSGTNLF